MPRLKPPSHRDLSRFCRDFTDLRQIRVPLTSKGGLPYKPRDLKSAGDPHRWRFSGAKPPSAARYESDVGRSFGSTPDPGGEAPVKRTYQPSKIVRKRRHGFRARMATKAAARWSQPGASRAASGSAPDPDHHDPMVRLKQRADFLAAASGAKVATAAFVLQGRNRDDDGPARIGFTVSRKVGTAVERNRVRRRLRDIVRRVAATACAPATTTCWWDGAPR